MNSIPTDVQYFLRSLLDPDKFGHAVTAEVRDEARVLLGWDKVETVREVNNEPYTVDTRR